MIVDIKKLDTDAVGVAKVNNRTVLVDGVLPEEVVDIERIADKGKYDVARLIEVVEPSEHRVDSLCLYYSECGGCTMQHASTEFEKKFKISKVVDAFKYVAGKEIEVDEYVDCDHQYGYRNKSVFAVKDGVVGMYSHSSRDILDIPECMIAKPEINQFYSTIRTWIQRYAKGLNHVVIREINGYYLCVLVGTHCPNISDLIDTLDKKYLGKYQIAYNNNDARKDILTGDIKILYGCKIMTNFKGVTMPVSANSFLQVNDEMSDRMYDDVLHAVKSKVVINAYSGAGLLTAMLAKSSSKVYGIEIVKNAHKDAQELKKINKITNITNICGDASIVLPDIINKNKDVTLIIDPPRKGVDNRLLDCINNSNNIKEIIYIACSPNSLAKNYARLTNYDISSLKLYNLFPKTHHVETLAIMKRR